MISDFDLGFGTWDWGFGTWDLGPGIWGLGFGIWDLCPYDPARPPGHFKSALPSRSRGFSCARAWPADFDGRPPRARFFGDPGECSCQLAMSWCVGCGPTSRVSGPSIRTQSHISFKRERMRSPSCSATEFGSVFSESPRLVVNTVTRRSL